MEGYRRRHVVATGAVHRRTCAIFHDPSPSPDKLPEKLHTSTTLFESVFNGSPIGGYLLSPTPEAFILAVSDTFLEASSHRREDLVGTSLFVAFPGNPNDPEDTGEMALRNSLARVVATGKPDTLPAQTYPIRVEMPNGAIVYGERILECRKTVLVAVTGYGQESDRKHALASGFDHYLVKPIVMKHLFAILADVKRA